MALRELGNGTEIAKFWKIIEKKIYMYMYVELCF